MPIECPITFPRLNEAEMGKLDYAVMHHAFVAHKELGCLCDESVYHTRFTQLLNSAGFQAERGVPVNLTFRNFFKPLYLDLVLNRSAVYELKAVERLTEAHMNQLLNYLFLTNAARGKLINFRPSSVESRFVNSLLTDRDRRDFRVIDDEWEGPNEFRDLIVNLVADWGTGLDQSHYTQAIVHCLGGEDSVIRQLPMQIGLLPLGNQRFHLATNDAAFRITTFQAELSGQHHHQLRKLLVPSPLACLYWVNIARHEVTLTTIFS